MKNLTATICLTIAAIVIVVWLGWKLRVSWSRFRFWRSRRRGAKGERFAVDLLSKNGYEVLSTQIPLDGTIEGDSVPLEFNTRVDYLVEKDGQQFRFQYRKYAA